MNRVNAHNTKEMSESIAEVFGLEVLDEKELKDGFHKFVKYASSKPNFDMAPIDTLPKLPMGQEQNSVKKI